MNERTPSVIGNTAPHNALNPCYVKAYESLFDDSTPEVSLWHGRPFGLHAFGCLHHVPSGAVKQSSQVDTGAANDYERRHWPAEHWPSLSHSTVYVLTYDAFNVWVEGEGIGRDRFVRVSRRWDPSHLAVVWRAGEIEIALKVAMVDGDRALIATEVVNRGETPFRGRLVVRGDANRLNCTANEQDWGRTRAKFRWADASTVAMERTTEWGMGLDFFPYFAALKTEDRQYRWIAMHHQMAFAVGGSDWKQDAVDRGDGTATWQLSKEVTLRGGGKLEFGTGFAGNWSGRRRGTGAMSAAVAKRAREVLSGAGWGEIVARGRTLWESFFEKVPVLKGDWPPELVRLYYKAWTSVYYNTIPPTDMIFYRSRHNLGVCCKVAPSTMAMCPATWESSLIALCMALVDPRSACDLLEGVYEATEPDGFLSEMPGNTRATQLAAVEPFVAWVCFRRSGDLGFLKRVYPALQANLFYKLHHPTWKHHGPHMVRNYAYAHIAAIYALKIAAALKRPAREIRKLEQALEDSRRAVNAFWNDAGGFYNANFVPALGVGLGEGVFEEGTDAEALIPLFRICPKAHRPRLLQLIREEFLTDGGAVRRKPKTLPAAASGSWKRPGNQDTFTLKESNAMFLPKGIKDLDRELFDRIARGTLSNIRKDGDFWECYDHRGMGRHNGPGSIFGAFATIWLLLLSENQVDDLYE